MSPMVGNVRKLLHIISCFFLVEVVVMLLCTVTLGKSAKRWCRCNKNQIENFIEGIKHLAFRPLLNIKKYKWHQFFDNESITCFVVYGIWIVFICVLNSTKVKNRGDVLTSYVLYLYLFNLVITILRRFYIILIFVYFFLKIQTHFRFCF